jgi:hypothetical protein
LCGLLFWIYMHQPGQDEMGWACNAHGKDNKCVQSFGWETWKGEVTRKM